MAKKPQSIRLEEPEEPAPKKRQASIVGGRTLPHSTEAEESLLSACLLDDGVTMTKAIEAGIVPESFYEQNRGIVYEHLQRLHERGEPVEASVLAEELKKSKQLERVGGYAFITQVSGRVSTTAQAGYFIERVREQSILRNLIRTSAQTVEECYNFSGDIDGFLAEQTARVNLSANGYAGNDDDILARLFDIKKLAGKPAPIFSVANVPVCTPGNLTTIYAISKGGKTALESGMMAATLTNPTSGHDTLGFVGPNYAGHAVLHFDTEQSKHDWQQKSVLSAMKRVGMKEPPPWLLSAHLTGESAARCVKIFRQAVRFAKKRFGGIHCIFIDGVADFVKSPNNEEECYELVRLLHSTAIEYECAVICILHLNPMSKAAPIEKGRGHLGSQLERKSESNLTLQKKGEITVLVAEGRQRNAPIPTDKAPAFRWSDEFQMHRSCPPPDAAEPKISRGRPPTYAFSEFKFIFPARSEPPKRIAELHRLLIQTVPIKSMGVFYNLLRRFAEEGLIESVDIAGGRAYRLTV